jgi:hypothetical protein
MANPSVNLQISIEQIVDLILQLPKNEQENIIKQIATQKEKTGTTYTEFSEKINGFRFLEKNWDSYNADTISDKAIQKAISILDKIIQTTQNHSIKLHVFPMRNGGIQFELDNENQSFEIEIDTNGILKFIRFDEEGDILEEINNFEIEKLATVLSVKINLTKK